MFAKISPSKSYREYYFNLVGYPYSVLYTDRLGHRERRSLNFRNSDCYSSLTMIGFSINSQGTVFSLDFEEF